MVRKRVIVVNTSEQILQWSLSLVMTSETYNGNGKKVIDRDLLQRTQK